jgi:cytochrome c
LGSLFYKTIVNQKKASIMKATIKLAFIVSTTLLLASCGGGEPKNGGDSTANNSSKPAETATASSKGLELIGASDCTTCHRLQKEASGASIGPAYSEVADKYSPAADTTVDRLVKKIIAGGSGVWGTTPMTPHSSVPEADVKEMVKYILSLKK